MPVRPITPNQVTAQKKGMIPDEVIQAFNETIAKHYNNGRSNFTQSEVVKLIVLKGIPEDVIFENHWLDVEILYEKSGWKVEYDKPAYCESYAANFTFTRKE